MPSCLAPSSDEVEFVWERRRSGLNVASSIIDIDDLSDDTSELSDNDDNLDIYGQDVIDLTDNTLAVDQALDAGEHPITCIRTPRMVITKGDFVQVEDVQFGQYQVEYLEVQSTTRTRDQSRPYGVRGIPYVRTSSLHNRLPGDSREICKILHYHRPEGSHALLETPLFVKICARSIIRKRQVVLTNAVWPSRPTARSGLICRWKLEVYFTAHGRTTRPNEEALVRLGRKDIPDSGHRVSEKDSARQWRGSYFPGGSWCSSKSLEQRCRGKEQRYTLFDAFCGAGGVSKGAQNAGFKVRFAVDKSPEV